MLSNIFIQECLYVICTGVLLVTSTSVIQLIALPTVLLLLKVLSTMLCTIGLKPGVIFDWHTFADWDAFTSHGSVVLVYLGSSYSALKILQIVGLDVLVLLYSISPVIGVVVDVVAHGRQLPSLRSLACILGLALCACVHLWLSLNGGQNSLQSTKLNDMFAQIDTAVKDNTVFLYWAAFWYGFHVLDMVHVEKIVSTTPLDAWHTVFYQDLLSIPTLVCAAYTSSAEVVLSSLASCWSLGTPVLALLASAAAVMFLSTHWQTLPPLKHRRPSALVLPAANVAALLIYRGFVEADSTPNASSRLANQLLCIGLSALYSPPPLRHGHASA
mmetsp:Transcript_12170/g.25537  ORF Transcript_12170/g.25537 Transcript_12170/m.25537 type:complete len:329 (-) Transcript_12170:451-1437(-)